MGNCWSLVLLVLAACQPMYGAAPQKLRSPAPIRPPATLPDDDATAQLPYAEHCDFFTTKVAKVKRETAAAEIRTREGDAKVAAFEAAPPAAKTDLIIDGIDAYAAALKQDPFNATATLKLALAYDKVRRKGCALALLERLEQLAQNPAFAREANDAIDEITQRGNRTWFQGYRREALRAVGRTGP